MLILNFDILTDINLRRIGLFSLICITYNIFYFPFINIFFIRNINNFLLFLILIGFKCIFNIIWDFSFRNIIFPWLIFFIKFLDIFWITIRLIITTNIIDFYNILGLYNYGFRINYNRLWRFGLNVMISENFMHISILINLKLQTFGDSLIELIDLISSTLTILFFKKKRKLENTLL